ncbi:MAG: 1,4-beta-xylanase, partial [Bacilli bacterium]|nr:1,4-beta-xylanase [Bacilli bacterium]
WCIMGDRYNAGSGYLPFSTTDIEDTTGAAWSIYPSSKFSWGNGGKRHGSVLKLTSEESAAIAAKWLA